MCSRPPPRLKISAFVNTIECIQSIHTPSNAVDDGTADWEMVKTVNLLVKEH